jgi:hypothetical protein
MADVIYLILIGLFFGLMVLLVKACDHIIGPEDTGSTSSRDASSTR